MQVQLVLSFLLALVAATPYSTLERHQQAKRDEIPMKNGWEPEQKSKGRSEPCLAAIDCDYSHLTMNDLNNGPCKAITLIFARATTEFGNMVCSNLNMTFDRTTLM
jgi:hypothetical protein